MTSFVFLITTDGSRDKEMERLVDSFAYVDSAAVFLLLQNGAELPRSLAARLPVQNVLLRDERKIPLSVARNRLLDEVEAYAQAFKIGAQTVVLLADDDCWYPEEFFTRFPAFDEIAVCQALDPESGKHFSTFNLSKRRAKTPLASWELMFYGVSISFLFRYDAIRGMRFKENIGLGNKVSQGEESLFVMRLLERNRELRVSTCPGVAVYHPWKFATSTNNHSSLGYFLGWSVARGFPSVLPFFFFLWCKYFVAMVVRPKKLYWGIFRTLGSSFVKGAVDIEKIGAPHA
jgi:hypothetical protein